MRAWLTAFVLVLLAAGPVRADAVDDAFVQGNAAAERNDWRAAVAAYEEAAAALPKRNAVVSYNLGTAYANLGDLGRATYHLNRAMDWRGGPSAELLEAARANLSAVRRSVELQATANSNMVDRPQTSWDLVVEAFGATGIRWLSLASAWLFLVVLYLHRRRLRAERPGLNVTRAALVVLGTCAVVTGSAYTCRRIAPTPTARRRSCWTRKSMRARVRATIKRSALRCKAELAFASSTVHPAGSSSGCPVECKDGSQSKLSVGSTLCAASAVAQHPPESRVVRHLRTPTPKWDTWPFWAKRRADYNGDSANLRCGALRRAGISYQTGCCRSSPRRSVRRETVEV